MSICVINASGTFFNYEDVSYLPSSSELKHFTITDRVITKYAPIGSAKRTDNIRMGYITLAETLLRERAYVDEDILFVFKDEEVASTMKEYIQGRYGCSIGYVTKRGDVCEL